MQHSIDLSLHDYKYCKVTREGSVGDMCDADMLQLGDHCYITRLEHWPRYYRGGVARLLDCPQI
jgi:hypothetical protein